MTENNSNYAITKYSIRCLAEIIWHGYTQLSEKNERIVLSDCFLTTQEIIEIFQKAKIITKSERGHLISLPNLHEIDEFIDIQKQNIEDYYDKALGLVIYAYAGISTEREPFCAKGYAEQLMWACVSKGYAVRVADKFEWTDNIAPIMIRENQWTSDTLESITSLKKEANSSTRRQNVQCPSDMAEALFSVLDQRQK